MTLPAGYDPTKPYPIIFEGPGCGGSGLNLYKLPDLDGSVSAGDYGILDANLGAGSGSPLAPLLLTPRDQRWDFL